LADFACHYMDLPCWALGLSTPTTVEAIGGPPPHAHSTPPELIVRYCFEARGPMPPVELKWYHGGLRPPHLKSFGVQAWSNGVLFVGQRGMLLADYERYVLLPEEEFADYEPPAPFIEESIGHHREWIRACKGGAPAPCRFEYGALLTQTALLGNVAYRTGKKLEWDARLGRVINAPRAGAFISKEYRKGWELPV
jgi:hypothetical protein